jgi:hypothetical protein
MSLGRMAFRLLNVLAGACCVIAVMGSNTKCVAAKESSLAQTSPPSCPHPSGWNPTEPELRHILARHLGYLSKVEPHDLGSDQYLDHLDPPYPDWRREALSNPERANLCFAYLTGRNLSGVNLTKANLTRACLMASNLSGANLREADLSYAELSRTMTGATLRFANLTKANLIGLELTGADIVEARLLGADMAYAKLKGADLSGSNLNNANLTGTDLDKAKLAMIDLTDATYAPAGSGPPDSNVIGIKGLKSVHILAGQQTGMVQLRKLLEDGGLKEEERLATYSIERSVTTEQFGHAPTFLQNTLVYFGYIDWVELLGLSNSLRLAQALSPEKSITSTEHVNIGRFAWIVGLLRIVGFDLTTAYGMQPTHALTLIGYLWGIFTLVYMWPIRQVPKNGKAGGIFQVFPSDRIDETAIDPTVVKEPKVVRVKAANWLSALRWASYFSLLSAINIGFEQITPGDWIRRLQGREYSLQAVGSVRRLAGAQALMSVYLLAMWVLTEFGRPFG